MAIPVSISRARRVRVVLLATTVLVLLFVLDVIFKQNQQAHLNVERGGLGGDTIGNAHKRILLYVTTHMSASHFWYLQSCWPKVLDHSSLLRNSDVMVHLTAPEDVRELATEQLRWTFHGQPNLTIHSVHNPGYQEGAISAMKDALEKQWFADYDWIIRLNPDVIVRNDSFLSDTIYRDPNATAVLVDCIPPGYDRNNFNKIQRQKILRQWTGPLIHTDFFALKTSALSLDSALFRLTPRLPAAEMSFSSAIREIVLNKGGHRIFPGAGPLEVNCRVGDGRNMDDTPLVHIHFDEEVKNNQIECPISFGG